MCQIMPQFYRRDTHSKNSFMEKIACHVICKLLGFSFANFLGTDSNKVIKCANKCFARALKFVFITEQTQFLWLCTVDLNLGSLPNISMVC